MRNDCVRSSKFRRAADRLLSGKHEPMGGLTTNEIAAFVILALLLVLLLVLLLR